MARNLVTILVACSCSLSAQPSCPQPNFLGPKPYNLEPDSTAHIDAVRQSDGSYTAFEVTDAVPYGTIAVTPHLEQQLAACLGHTVPPNPLVMSFLENPPGAGSQLQVAQALSGGRYFTAKLSADSFTR